MPDPGLVLTGTKCGHGKVSVRRRDDCSKYSANLMLKGELLSPGNMYDLVGIAVGLYIVVFALVETPPKKCVFGVGRRSLAL